MNVELTIAGLGCFVLAFGHATIGLRVEAQAGPVVQRGRSHALLAQPTSDPVGLLGAQDHDVGRRPAGHRLQADPTRLLGELSGEAEAVPLDPVGVQRAQQPQSRAGADPREPGWGGVQAGGVAGQPHRAAKPAARRGGRPPVRREGPQLGDSVGPGGQPRRAARAQQPLVAVHGQVIGSDGGGVEPQRTQRLGQVDEQARADPISRRTHGWQVEPLALSAGHLADRKQQGVLVQRADQVLDPGRTLAGGHGHHLGGVPARGIGCCGTPLPPPPPGQAAGTRQRGRRLPERRMCRHGGRVDADQPGELPACLVSRRIPGMWVELAGQPRRDRFVEGRDHWRGARRSGRGVQPHGGAQRRDSARNRSGRIDGVGMLGSIDISADLLPMSAVSPCRRSRRRQADSKREQ